MEPVPVNTYFLINLFSLKLIKEDNETFTFLRGLYEVKFPTKNNFGLKQLKQRNKK